MTETKLSFESEKLRVHFLTLNVSDLEDIKEIADYLRELGFNSWFKSSEKAPRMPVIIDNNNKFQVIFVKKIKGRILKDSNKIEHWSGISIRFTGEHGDFFYKLIKKKKVNWNIFNLPKTNLGRFDLHYLRDLPKSESGKQLEFFLHNSCEKTNARGKKQVAKWSRNKKGKAILTISYRESNTFVRVYQKNKKIGKGEDLEFEIEIKGRDIKDYQDYLFESNFENFEDLLVKFYYNYLQKRLELNSCFMHWLLIGLRKAKQSSPYCTELKRSSYFISPYLEDISQYLDSPFRFGFINKDNNYFKSKNLFNLLQLLSFFQFSKKVSPIKKYRLPINSLPSRSNMQRADIFETYYIVEFSLKDYLKFISKKTEYKEREVTNFLKSLQANPPILEKDPIYVEDMTIVPCFSMFPIFAPVLKGRELNFIVHIGKELFEYKYPFCLPEFFHKLNSKYDVQVRVQFLRCISTMNFKKKFDSEEFVNEFSLSNSDKKTIRTLIIDFFKKLEKHRVIEDKFTIFYKKDNWKEKEFELRDLTPLKIAQSKYIVFNERFDIPKFY